MNISIKDYLATKGINGNIILYRDKQHKKKALCEYLAKNISTDKTICIYSGGAFGLYIAKAFPNNKVVICGSRITDEYKQQIVQMSNATIIEGLATATNAKTKVYAEANGYFYINQFDNPFIKAYYKNHLVNIIAELQGTSINAFCDAGHSCGTMAGFIESGLTSWQFVLGVNIDGRTNVHYLTNLTDKFVQETTLNFDTAVLQAEIEAAYPSFGNIFEATRSISAAMSWLQKNPNKTVLVYVGDSPVFGEDFSF